MADNVDTEERGNSLNISVEIFFHIEQVEGAVLVIEYTIPGRVKIFATIRSFFDDNR